MTFKTIVTVLNVSLIFALTMTLFIQDKRLQSCKLKLTEEQASVALQNEAISHMKIESDKLAARVKDAQAAMQHTKIIYDDKIKTVYNAKIPTSCEGAVQWAILQSKSF